MPKGYVIVTEAIHDPAGMAADIKQRYEAPLMEIFG